MTNDRMTAGDLAEVAARLANTSPGMTFDVTMDGSTLRATADTANPHRIVAGISDLVETFTGGSTGPVMATFADDEDGQDATFALNAANDIRRLLAEVESRGRTISALSQRCDERARELDEALRAKRVAEAELKRLRAETGDDDGLTGEEYWEEIKAFQADLAEYCRAVDVDGCACVPRPKFPALADMNRWCREHGLLAIVPAELTQSISGIRGGEPCMLNTRVPVEQVSTLLEDGATWDFVKETYPSIPTPEAPREATQSPSSAPGTVQESTGRGTGAGEAPGGAQGGSDG